MTKKLWITARAFPYNEANSHNETILPGAFAPGKTWRCPSRKCPVHKSGVELPVPMLDMHDDDKVVGQWTDYRDTSEGMFVYGYVEEPVPSAR